MEYNKVSYKGQETDDFDTLVSWFQELKDENRSMSKVINELQRINRTLKGDNASLQKSLEDKDDYARTLEEDRRKTEEVLKRYCGDSVDCPVSTIVGLIIDDYFYQKAETENQVRELQKAEKTIDKLNKELVEYADKVKALEKDASFIPTLPTLAEKINNITCRYHMPVTPIDHRKARTEHIFQCVQELAEYAKKQRDHIYSQDAIIANQTEQINELEEKLKNWEKRLWNPEWSRLIDKLNEIIDREAPRSREEMQKEIQKVYINAEDKIWGKLNYLAGELCLRNSIIQGNNKHIRRLENKANELDVIYRRLKLENEKLILTQGSNAIEHATEITNLKQEISALKTELEERKNKRSPRWPSDVMRIGTLENKVDELTRENERLRYSQPWMYERSRYSQPWMYGMSSKEATNRIFGINGTIHKLMEENKKLKDALEFCQKEASSARAHAHNVEVNAERIRLGID